MKTLGSVLALLAMAGCATHPDSLRLVKRDVALVDYVAYVPSQPSGTLAIALHFEGNAPYAAIANEGRQAQFRCHALSAAGVPLTDIDSGWVFFVGQATPETPADQATPLFHSELTSQGDRYRYQAILYPGLKANTAINQPADFDLLARDYDRIQCQLVGVRMVGGFMYSNALHVSRAELVELVGRNSTK